MYMDCNRNLHGLAAAGLVCTCTSIPVVPLVQRAGESCNAGEEGDGGGLSPVVLGRSQSVLQEYEYPIRPG